MFTSIFNKMEKRSEMSKNKVSRGLVSPIDACSVLGRSGLLLDREVDMAYRNATIKIYPKTASKNDEGTSIYTWGYKATPPAAPVATIRGDVQPKNLTDAELQLYGITTVQANTMVYYGPYNSNLALKNRVAVTLDGGGGEQYYNVQPMNTWPHHMEVLFIPVQGE